MFARSYTKSGHDFPEVIILANLRDLSEISRGEGRWKIGEGHSYFEPFKREGYEKNDTKRGSITKN